MKGIRKRRDISIFQDQCETSQRRKYSKKRSRKRSPNHLWRIDAPSVRFGFKIIQTITPSAVPGSDQRVSLAAQGPDMQSTQWLRAKPLSRQAEQDCELKPGKAVL